MSGTAVEFRPREQNSPDFVGWKTAGHQAYATSISVVRSTITGLSIIFSSVNGFLSMQLNFHDIVAKI